jgi:hypothetical protein
VAPSPEKLADRVRRIAMAFPEATELQRHPERDRYNPAESAVAFRIRTRPFAQVATVVDPSGRWFTFVVCRTDPSEREALGAVGHPYFLAGGGRDRVGMVLDDRTDWGEVAEFVTESYRLNAPKTLAALVDEMG